MAPRDFDIPATLDSPADVAVLLSASATAIDPIPRAIYCNTAGDITWTDDDDTSHTWTLATGYHPIRPRKVTAITGAVVYALY